MFIPGSIENPAVSFLTVKSVAFLQGLVFSSLGAFSSEIQTPSFPEHPLMSVSTV